MGKKSWAPIPQIMERRGALPFPDTERGIKKRKKIILCILKK